MGITILLPLIYFVFTTFPLPKQTQSVPLQTSLSMFRDVHLVMLGLFLFFQSAFEGVVSNWTTTFLQDKHQIDPSDALLALSVFVFSLTLARLVLAMVLRHTSPFWVLLISMGIMGLGYYIPAFATGFFLLLDKFCPHGCRNCGWFPCNPGVCKRIVYGLKGTAFSFVFFIALIGIILVNYLVGAAGPSIWNWRISLGVGV